MKTAFCCVVLASLAGSPLHTEYKKDRAFRVQHHAHSTLQTTELEVELDGEPQELPAGQRPKSESFQDWTYTDRVLASADGKPTKVRRHFSSLTAKTTSSRNGEDREEETPSPFEDVTMDLTRDGDDVKVEVVEGKKPEHDGALTGHVLELPLDVLLPHEAVEKGTTWEIDDDAVHHALGLALQKCYFPRPAADEAPSESGEGRGRRGRMGQMSRSMGRSLDSRMEWSGTAEVASMREDLDGVECVKIQLNLHAQGAFPESASDGGGGRGGRVYSTELASTAVVENSYEAELEGALYFATESNRPVRLELTGKVTLETNRETTRGERTMKMHSKSAGELELRVDVLEAEAEAK